MIHNWEPWIEPSTAQEMQFTILARLQWTEDEPPNQRIYMLVFEALGTQQDFSGKIIVLNFADVVARISTDRDADFVEAKHDTARWGFVTDILGGPETLELLVEMLVSVSIPTVTYRLWTNGQRARIVREQIVDPEAVPTPAEPVATPRWNVCHITGQPHDFAPLRFRDLPINSDVEVTSRYCWTCRLRIATKGI